MLATLLMVGISILTLFVGWKVFERSLIGEWIIGLFIGIVWELFSYQMWIYKGFSLYFYVGSGREPVNVVPVALILLWPTVIAIMCMTSSVLYEHVFKRLKFPFSLAFLSSIALSSVVGMMAEIIGANEWLGFGWDYVAPENLRMALLGWIGMSLGAVSLAMLWDTGHDKWKKDYCRIVRDW